MKKTYLKLLPILLIGFVMLFTCKTAEAGDVSTENKPDAAEKKTDVHIVTGVKMITSVIWGFIPMPPSAAISVDVGYLRLRTDITFHPFANVQHVTIGAGAVFKPIGKKAVQDGGFQMKIPILAEVGFLAGEVEAGDGHDETLEWALVGPTVGMDLVWWKAGKVGFCISNKLGYLFRLDMNSDYTQAPYTYHADTIGVPELSIMFGIVL